MSRLTLKTTKWSQRTTQSNRDAHVYIFYVKQGHHNFAFVVLYVVVKIVREKRYWLYWRNASCERNDTVDTCIALRMIRTTNQTEFTIRNYLYTMHSHNSHTGLYGVKFVLENGAHVISIPFPFSNKIQPVNVPIPSDLKSDSALRSGIWQTFTCLTR